MIEDLKCCANCKNKDINDGGLVQCSFPKNVSSYNGVTCPAGFCERWEYDGLTKERRKEYI